MYGGAAMAELPAASAQSTDIATSTETAAVASTRHERDLHLLVGKSSALDDDVVVERDRAVAHGHVVMPFGRALAAALRIGAGGEQEISRDAPRAGVVTLRIGAIERDRVPAALQVEPPADLGDRMP